MNTIGIAGPLNIHHLNLSCDSSSGRVPRGLGGTVLPPLINELLQRGQRVTVFTLDQSIIETVNIKTDLLTIFICPCRINHRARDLFAQERKKMLELMLKEDVDIIHAHWTYEFALAALDSTKPTLITAHDDPIKILRYDFSPYRVLRTLMAAQVINKTKNMTAVSSYIGNNLQNFFHYNKKITVIPNGLSSDIFSKYKKKKFSSKNKIVFAAVSNGWGRRKNTKSLLNAFSIVQKSCKQVELWLFGIDHGPNELAEQWAYKNRCAEGVRFLGPTDHHRMLEILSSEADILVHPALEESFSLSIIESMALGLPVIAGKDSGAVPSTLGYGQAGILTDVSSPPKLAETMLELANNINLQIQIGDSGRNYAINHYRIEQVVDRYQSLYDLIAKGL